ncbi:hypothetical protein X975_07895, partial [Stegodyphus mimosarum]
MFEGISISSRDKWQMHLWQSINGHCRWQLLFSTIRA